MLEIGTVGSIQPKSAVREGEEKKRKTA